MLDIGRGFHTLINSRESIELHRVMITCAAHDPKLSKMFYEAGPHRLLSEMAHLLKQAVKAGKLQIAEPLDAADHFFCLVKGGANFRLLIGCAAALEGEAAERHVRDAVNVFVRAYRPEEQRKP